MGKQCQYTDGEQQAPVRPCALDQAQALISGGACIEAGGSEAG